jgi:hypothetical protein
VRSRADRDQGVDQLVVTEPEQRRVNVSVALPHRPQQVEQLAAQLVRQEHP